MIPRPVSTNDGMRARVIRVEGAAELIAVTLWDGEESEQRSDDAARAQREELARAAGASTSVEKFTVAFAEILDI